MIRRLLAIAVIPFCLAALAAAQELTTDAERTWQEVRDSDDVRTKLMAERWHNAIQQQEWSDASGKFTVSAKYVDHDPKLSWVKLRVIRGTGRERVVKDVQIPLDKLSKACQARVKTISVLREKLAEAAQKEQEKENDDDGENRAADAPGEPGPEAESRDARSEREIRRDPSVAREARSRRLPGNRRRAATAQPQDAATNDGPPLPALLPPLPTSGANESSSPTPPQAAPAAATPASGEPSPEFRHPTTEEELKSAFMQAFVSGDKEILDRLFYWGELSPEQRQFTRLNLLDYAGAAQLHRCEIAVEAGGDTAEDYTVKSTTYLLLEFETRNDYFEIEWPIGKVGGKYFLGALTHPAEPPKRR